MSDIETYKEAIRSVVMSAENEGLYSSSDQQEAEKVLESFMKNLEEVNKAASNLLNDIVEEGSMKLSRILEEAEVEISQTQTSEVITSKEYKEESIKTLLEKLYI
jgi:F0F1-type ATP synthase membrane subunit b/b'